MTLRKFVIGWALVLGLFWLLAGGIPPASAQVGGPIAYGQTVEGQLGHGINANYWDIQGQPGDVVTVVVERTGGDLSFYLQIHEAYGRGRVEIAARNLNYAPVMRLEGVTLPAIQYGGRLQIMVGLEGLGNGTTSGTYRLTLIQGAPEPTAAPPEPTQAPAPTALPPEETSEPLPPPEETSEPLPPPEETSEPVPPGDWLFEDHFDQPGWLALGPSGFDREPEASLLHWRAFGCCAQVLAYPLPEPLDGRFVFEARVRPDGWEGGELIVGLSLATEITPQMVYPPGAFVWFGPSESGTGSRIELLTVDGVTKEMYDWVRPGADSPAEYPAETWYTVQMEPIGSNLSLVVLDDSGQQVGALLAQVPPIFSFLGQVVIASPVGTDWGSGWGVIDYIRVGGPETPSVLMPVVP